MDELERDLRSEDEATVIAALHRACPCGGSSRTYEALMPLVRALQKDSRPTVRTVAMHLEVDAFQALAMEDERANGWVRNRPGGNPRRGETRRASRRYGLA